MWAAGWVCLKFKPQTLIEERRDRDRGAGRLLLWGFLLCAVLLRPRFFFERFLGSRFHSTPPRRQNGRQTLQQQHTAAVGCVHGGVYGVGRGILILLPLVAPAPGRFFLLVPDARFSLLCE